MKKLDFFLNLNLDSDEKIFEYLVSSLKNSIFTWDYFVDFEKTISNTEKIRKELDCLSSLIGISEDNIDTLFISLLQNHSKVRKAIPILLAIRDNKLADTHIIDDLLTLTATNKYMLFNPKIPMNEIIENDLLHFFKASGLRKLFIDNSISNLYDFCLGIEVGMDTNARKNRTGTNMENLVETLLENFCEANNCRYMVQATQSKLFNEWGYQVNVDKINRRFDFAIINSDKSLYLIEVNYYSGGGSKLKATAGEYKEVHNMLSSQNIDFIWITDGLGWNTAKTALFETCIHNDYVINLDMIGKGILEEIIN